MSRASATASLGPTRRRVLHRLQSDSAAASADAVADALRLHPNTARFHLDALVGLGLAERRTEDRSAPGRPRVLYAAEPASAHKDHYRELAGVLASALSNHAATPAAAAEAAGVDRGRKLAAELVGSQTQGMPAARATEAVVDGLGRLGFDSRPVSTRSARRIDIVPCPFLDLARARPDVVCSVHRGLMAGMLDQLHAPLAVDRLEPFVEPDRCVAHLRRIAKTTSGRHDPHD